MSNEAETSTTTTMTPEEEAGANVQALLWPEEHEKPKEPEDKEFEELKKPKDKEPEEPKDKEPKDKEPEEPKDKEPEAEEELSPQVLMKIARQKTKAAERKEKEVTAYVERVQQVAKQVAEKERILTGIIDKMPQDIGSAWDSFAKMANLDPKTAWEALVRAKVNGKKEELQPEKPSPEISSLKEMVEKLSKKLEEKETTNQELATQRALQEHHIATLSYVAAEKDAYEYANMLDEEELNAQIQSCILRGYAEHRKGNKDFDMSKPAIARAVDKYARTMYARWNRGASDESRTAAGMRNPAESPAKSPLKGPRKPSLTNDDTAESGSRREQTEAERLAEAGDIWLKLANS